MKFSLSQFFVFFGLVAVLFAVLSTSSRSHRYHNHEVGEYEIDAQIGMRVWVSSSTRSDGRRDRELNWQVSGDDTYFIGNFEGPTSRTILLKSGDGQRICVTSLDNPNLAIFGDVQNSLYFDKFSFCLLPVSHPFCESWRETISSFAKEQPEIDVPRIMGDHLRPISEPD